MPVEGTGLTIFSSLFNDCALCVVIAEIATAAAAATVTGGASAFPRWPSPQRHHHHFPVQCLVGRVLQVGPLFVARGLVVVETNNCCGLELSSALVTREAFVT